MNCQYNRNVPFDHLKNEEAVFDDLYGKYKKYGTLYVGVDFDNTLQMWEDSQDTSNGIAVNKIDSSMYSSASDKPTCVLNLLRRAQDLGMTLCLWTLPTSPGNLEWKIDWCKRNGLCISYVNESPLLWEHSKEFGKPHFNILLDDVAGLEGAYRILWNLCEALEREAAR